VQVGKVGDLVKYHDEVGFITKTECTFDNHLMVYVKFIDWPTQDKWHYWWAVEDTYSDFEVISASR